jgi:diguanylate cyclase (GGDEF)-like protein
VTDPRSGPTLRPDLTRFVQAWMKAVNRTRYVAMTREEKSEFLYGLAERLAAALLARPFDATRCYRVGEDLVAGGFSAEALGRTVGLLHARFLPDLGLTQATPGAVQPDINARLTSLIDAFVTGFTRAMHRRTLDAQESIRAAAMTARDEAERALRASEARLRHTALHDPLTDLPNWTLFTERLEHACNAAPEGARIGVCLIDLDSFKAINDSFGHPVGDQLLVAVADRLRTLAAEHGHLVARLGGDEFAILVEGTTCADDATKVADKALAVLAEPVRIDGQELPVSASIGVVERPVAGIDPTDVMRAADITLHWAKADGKARWTLFDPQRNGMQVARYRLAAALPNALANDQIFLVYQPMVDLSTGALVGFEALARWRHPELGVLDAGRFIGVAEDTGLIGWLGDRLLERACQEASAWSGLTATPPFVSVNVAVHQLCHPGLPGQVATVLDRTGLPPERLQLEITESALIDTSGEMLDTLRAVSELGVRVVIDDFGTGYANLAYLCELPVQGVKLAGNFLGRLRARTDEPPSDPFLATVVSLGHVLGLTVTAECVETDAQAARLRTVGCDLGQGYRFGHPMPAERVADQLTASG